jgi:GT2 family glycosyltransferase/glycosyltransferase involved in cell wall biosynthesis
MVEAQELPLAMSGVPVRCDVVVPVHNALVSTKNCLRTLKRYAPEWARLVVINDGSDARTTEWLRGQDGIVLLENEANLGFVKTANRGLLLSDAPWVCLLNSDTLMSSGALERMIARCERDERIGLCCPLSNNAVNLSVKIPPGEDVFSFAERVTRTSPALYPDAVTIVGFCLLVKRELIRSVGVFDEAFDRGYGEETDLHYRARAAGWRSVVADDTFVYHRHGASFTDSHDRTNRNLKIVMERWRETHESELAEFDRVNALGAVRDAATFAWIRPDDRPPPPHDVLFVLPMFGVFGGVAAVLELANALILDGLRAGVVVVGEALPEIGSERLFEPIRMTPEEFLANVPPAKILVATAYQTAPLVAVAAARRPGTQTAYFVQDYEGWFGADGPEYVGHTYALVPRMTAVSTWLADEIAKRHGIRPVPVPISARPDLFYPRGNRPPAPPVRVVAMLRFEERRGMAFLLPALARVGTRPDVEIVFFGQQELPAEAATFRFRHAGVLPAEKVASLLSSAHVVVDPSLFQGFGLVGLEGMSSGAACVVTASGGVTEYAVDGENALVVPPRDPAALAAAILRLVEDAPLRERLGAAGVVTACRFTWERTAARYREFLASLPPAGPPTPGERAALELLGRELLRGESGAAPLRAELTSARQTLDAIYRSRTWRLVRILHRIRGLMKGRR